MSSTEPTEVPPYFWTMVLIKRIGLHADADARVARLGQTVARRYAPSFERTNPSTLASAAPNAAGLLPPACAKSGRPPPLPPTCPATLPTSSPAFTLPVWSAVTPATSVSLLV